MAIYQGASDRSRGLPSIGGLLRLPGSGGQAAGARPVNAGRPRADDRPVAGRRPTPNRRASATSVRSASVAAPSTRPAAQARPRAAARPTADGRPAAPAVRAIASPRVMPAVRPLGAHAGRALPRNAALVGKRTIAVAVHRPRTAALGIASVAVVLLAVLFYLSQTFQAAAARYELDTLAAERDALLQELRSQDGIVVRWGSESYVGEWALGTDLDLLGRPKRFEAR